MKRKHFFKKAEVQTVEWTIKQIKKPLPIGS